MKKTSKNKIIEALYKEIERKDSLIEKLREENKILLRTAFKSAEEKIRKKAIYSRSKKIFL